jgi:hypothetical protein
MTTNPRPLHPVTRLLSVRLITDDVARLVSFYQEAAFWRVVIPGERRWRPRNLPWLEVLSVRGADYAYPEPLSCGYLLPAKGGQRC